MHHSFDLLRFLDAGRGIFLADIGADLGLIMGVALFSIILVATKETMRVGYSPF